MLDIRLIRENPKKVEENLLRRGDKEKIKQLRELLNLDEDRRKTIQAVEKLKQARNAITAEISKLKSQGRPIKAKMKEAKELPNRIKKLDEKLNAVEKKSHSILMALPNLLHESVPQGKDENDNVEIRKVGLQPKFDFTPKSHVEILQNLGLVDFERGAKVAGSGFVLLKNELALLDQAIQKFSIDLLMTKGFTLFAPPMMVNRRAYEGMIGNPFDFTEAGYKIEGEELFLIPTAEYPLGAMFVDEVFNTDTLPIKLCGVSSSFRKEVGAHGKYTKGLFRMHQFNKVEEFVFCLPEESWKIFEELQKISEELYQKLGLHYRVVVLCSGDTGTKSAKTYDIEVWMADGKFREAGSCSNCTDYQARRLGIRYREKEGFAPSGFVHTLNNTALATSRTMIAIVEQNQQADGTVEIPQALRPYTGFKRLEKK